jgi:hypothetical protein
VPKIFYDGLSSDDRTNRWKVECDCGKVRIDGRNWKEVFDKLVTADLSKETLAKLKLRD